MIIQTVSDLHLEFFDKEGDKVSLLEKLMEVKSDVLVIAGDLSNATNIEEDLILVNSVISNKKIIFVPGNHDYYGGFKQEVDQKLWLLEIENKLPNITILNNSVCVIDDVIFIGGTGWFNVVRTELCRYITDFSAIRDIRLRNYGLDWSKECLNTFQASLVSFGDEVKAGKRVVCVTHHLPSYEVVPSIYKGEELNCFFVNDDFEYLIRKYFPNLWIFGHTHENVDKIIEKTRCICNPFGYYKREENKAFKYDIVIEV